MLEIRNFDLFFFFLLFLFFIKRNVLTDNVLIYWPVYNGNTRWRRRRARGLLIVSILFKYRMFIKNGSTSLTNYGITSRHFPKLFKNIKFNTHNICVNFLFIMPLWLDSITNKLLLL